MHAERDTVLENPSVRLSVISDGQNTFEKVYSKYKIK